MVAGWLLFPPPRARTNVRQSAARVFIEIYSAGWTLNIFVPFTIYRWVDIFTNARQLDYARFLVAQVRGELI